ncbi:MAG: amidohydrolase family protein [bacterium]|nr:amidohydrolase family protein [bacterium]
MQRKKDRQAKKQVKKNTRGRIGAKTNYPGNYGILWLLLVFVLLIGAGCRMGEEETTVAPTEDAADTVLINGQFYTVDEANSWAEAIAIDDGTIVYVGSMEGIDAYKGEQTEVIDLNGKFAMPSFVDSHLHPLSNAYSYLYQAALFNLNNHEAYIAAIKEFAENHADKEGIMGAGFDRYLYDDIGPRKEWLDAIDSQRPIAIIDKDIHTMWVNSKVFEMLGWDAGTPDPEGGVIVRGDRLCQVFCVNYFPTLNIRSSHSSFRSTPPPFRSPPPFVFFHVCKFASTVPNRRPQAPAHRD